VGIFDFLKKDKWRYVMQGNFDKPVWNTQKDKQFITEGYNRVVWVYACVSAISGAVSSVPWLLYRKGRGGRLIEITDHPILTMLNSKANPHMSGKDFIDYWATYLAIEGKFYAEYSNPNAPMAMYPLYPHYMYPIPHRTEFIGGYEYRLDTPILYTPEEILWSKFNDPLDVYQGQSPIRALSRTIDTENEAVDWNKSTLQNAGVPPGVFQIQNPSPELQETLREEWRKRYAGGSNARIPLILNADKATYQQIGLSAMDMDFLNQRKVNRTEICSAFGVPSQIVGDPEGQTYSNYGEAQKAFWENTVISRYLDHILDKLQSDLLPRYSDSLVLKYDLTGVGALKENEDKKATRIRELWKAGLIKRNEGRYALDYEDDPVSGNLYFNELAIGTATAPIQEVEQPAPIQQPEEMEPEEMEEPEEIELEDGDEEEEATEIQIEIAKKKVPTNFPVAGEDKTISLANSQFELFPLDYAEDLRNNFPDIWAKGGNIQGNDTYRVIRRVRDEGKSADELTPNDIEIIRMREAWSARHYRDHRLAGVIAQVKWHMVGSRGLDHMKAVIQEAKDKQKKSVDMSPDEMKSYWKRIDAERERYIQKTQREIKRYFGEQKDDLMNKLKGASPFQAERLTDQVITATSKDLRNILIAMNRAVIDHFGKQQYNDLRREKMHNKAFEAYTDDLLYWITVNVGNAVVLIDDTTRAEIKNIIMMGINAGWAIGDEETPDTIAYAIGQLYLDQIIPNRSETIARTETMTAANKGSLSGAQQAESEFGARLLKIWIPTQDGDTRDTHAEMSSHPAIALTAKFRVGQSLGEYPADWELSARERINCRCAVGYVRERETEV
jgi:HK97 family phage portal protein